MLALGADVAVVDPAAPAVAAAREKELAEARGALAGWAAEVKSADAELKAAAVSEAVAPVRRAAAPAAESDSPTPAPAALTSNESQSRRGDIRSGRAYVPPLVETGRDANGRDTLDRSPSCLTCG